MLKILVIGQLILAAAGLTSAAGQSATDRHAVGNYPQAAYDFGHATSANARHAPGNYAPLK